MKILISNDDGIQSPGIVALANVAQEMGDVVVVAPHRERSTAGHSLTLHKPLRVQQQSKNWYSTSGSPADCVYLGIREILKNPPDILLSGINIGANLGTDVHYSGTVAAAREGALGNIRSYAFSLVDMAQVRPGEPKRPLRFDVAAEFALKVIQQTCSLEFPDHTLINVNIPSLDASEIRGIRVSRQGFRFYSNHVARREDPRGQPYYWLGGGYKGFAGGKECDCDAIQENYVSVTPLTIDCTHEVFAKRLVEALPKK